MKQIFFVVATIALSTYLGWVVLRMLQKNAVSRGKSWPNPFYAIGPVAIWGFVSFSAITLAFSTTTMVRTTVVMNNMAHIPPFAAIIKTDPVETAKLRAAVSSGVADTSSLGMQAAVRKNLSDTLKPYLNDRLAHAPDQVFLRLAPIVLGAMTNTQALGACVLVGDRNPERLRHGMDAFKIAQWADQLIETPRQAQDKTVSSAEAADRSQALKVMVVEDGAKPTDVDQALVPDGTGAGRCQAGTLLLQKAMGQADRARAARDVRILLRRFELPG